MKRNWKDPHQFEGVLFTLSMSDATYLNGKRSRDRIVLVRPGLERDDLALAGIHEELFHADDAQA